MSDASNTTTLEGAKQLIDSLKKQVAMLEHEVMGTDIACFGRDVASAMRKHPTITSSFPWVSFKQFLAAANRSTFTRFGRFSPPLLRLLLLVLLPLFLPLLLLFVIFSLQPN